MSNRITSIALFDKDSLNKFDESVQSINEHFCKVPFREENRETLDTLPYHFTFTVWDSSQKDIAMEIIKNIKFSEIELKIIGVNVKESFNDSYNLYFEIERNNELYLLQKQIYDLAKIEKYNPDNFVPHITIHCDKDYEKLVKIKETIMKEFIDFEVQFKQIGLFEIYPAKQILITQIKWAY